MISEDLKKKIKKCWKVILSILRHLPIFFEDFRFFFRRLTQISKDFQKFRKLVGMFILHPPVLFPKFSKEFPNIQERRHEPLLLVTDQPLKFFVYVINKNAIWKIALEVVRLPLLILLSFSD